MSGQFQKKQSKRKSGFPVAAAVTGAVVGAGIVAAGIVAMKDKKNREKVKKVLTNVNNRAKDYMKDIRHHAQDKKAEVEEKLDEVKEKLQKI